MHRIVRPCQRRAYAPIQSLGLRPTTYIYPLTNRNRLSIRSVTSEAGDFHTGHLDAKPNEGILFFDNVFPLKLRWALRFSFHGETQFQRLSPATLAAFNPADLLKKALPADTTVKVGDIIPRLKDGGAFVRFSHDETMSSSEVASKVREYLKKEHIRPWWNPFHHVRARLVQGRPWVQDLYRPPSCRLMVEFVPQTGSDAVELSQEQLYAIFRPFGKLREITSQPQDSKILPKYAFIDFAGTKQAIMAHNCLHGLEVPSDGASGPPAKLKIAYQHKERAHWFRDWIFNHPRIVIPLLAAFATVFAVTVFDPIRTFNIRMHIKRAFHITDHPLYRWFLSRAENILTFGRRREKDPGMHAIWDERKDDIDQIERWLMETADTFIVVQGPRGSGKRELVVDAALKDRKDKLVIDCKAIQEARGDNATINATAQQVGYRPVFSWMNSISGLIDLAAQGAAGVKTGFSETLDGQLNKILNNTATALKQIGLEGRSKQDDDADISDDQYMETHPERRPVVVIDNFLHKSQEGGIIYDKIAEWAANLTTANIAHVIFLTTDVSFSKSLSKALPDRVFRQLSLGDCSPEVAKRFVLSHLEAASEKPTSAITMTSGPNKGAEKLVPLSEEQKQRNLAELDDSLACLGGRLTDLEFLARRIKAGETPSKAVKEIVEQSASEILKMYILGADKTTSSATPGVASQRLWTPEQAWALIKGLADCAPNGGNAGYGGNSGHGGTGKTDNDGCLRYNEVILSDAFKGSNADAVLQSLEQAELISIVSRNGRPMSIRPGKPVYISAFKLLTEDKVLASRLDMAIVNDMIKTEVAGIDKTENELSLLAALPKQPAEIGQRVQYLLDKLNASQNKVVELEAKAARLKKVLVTEF